MADDDQQQRETQHQGRTIKVTATRQRVGWSWSYLIDGGTHSVGRVPCPDAETALRQGLNAARAKVDRM